MSNAGLSILATLYSFIGAASAQVTMSVSLDPSAPAGRVTADVYADVASTDAWRATGIRAVTMNGAAFHYAGTDDPNSPYPDFVIAPYGMGAVTDQHVTCLSRPRSLRNSSNRFNLNADAYPDSRYSPFGLLPTIVATSTELNVTWVGLPLPGPSTPSQDGYIARISFDCAVPPGAALRIGPIDLISPQATVLLLCDGAPSRPQDPGMISVTFDFPIPAGIDWAIWYELDCIGDIDNSGEVNLVDLTTLLGHFGTAGNAANGDIDGNGQVDLIDLTFLLANFGFVCL